MHLPNTFWANFVSCAGFSRLYTLAVANASPAKLNVELDAFIFMPDHMHGIIHLGELSNTSLSNVIQNYKSITARKIRAFTKSKVNQVWQRNYYEHIIRTEKSLNLIRLYIELNPRMKEEHTELRNLQDLTDEKIDQILAPYRDR